MKYDWHRSKAVIRSHRRHRRHPAISPMAMGTATLLTATDLLDVPDPDLPHELWRGVLHAVTPASWEHGMIVGRLFVPLGQHVFAHGLGEVFSEATGFLLERGPDTVLCPDIAFVAKDRLAAGRFGSPFPELAPDLAVEVLSPSSRPAETRTKGAAYLALGVCSVWVIDPARRTVRIPGAAGEGLVRQDHVLGCGAV